MALPIIKRSASGSGFDVIWPNGSITEARNFSLAKAAVEGYNDAMFMQRGELEAENAWLRAAESYDDGFEAWERGRGLAADPQSGY